MRKVIAFIQRQRVLLSALSLSIVTAVYATVPSVASASCGGPEEPACGLGESFDPASTASTLLSKLGTVGVAVVSIFVAVFLFTVGLHFFRRNGKTVAK